LNIEVRYSGEPVQKNYIIKTVNDKEYFLNIEFRDKRVRIALGYLWTANLPRRLPCWWKVVPFSAAGASKPIGHASGASVTAMPFLRAT
jgi:hypothetical protein